MKKFSEAVLALHKHMSKKASPYHAHSQGLVYTPSGKTEVRPIDTADAGYGGEAVSDAEGGEADAGKASKRAVSPMKMQTLVKKTNEETERERLLRMRSFAHKQKLKGLGADIHEPVSEEVEQVDETRRMSPAEKLGRAFDRERERTETSRRRARELLGRTETPQEREDRLSALATGDKAGRRAHGERFSEEVEQYDWNGPEEENDMAMTQLHFIKYAAEEIMDAIKVGTDMEEWYQNKLTRAHLIMEGLHSYMEGKKRHHGSLGDPVSKGKMKDIAEEEVWDKPMPDSKKQGSLSPEQKAKAKARAERAGRSYPNMIDNMWASKQ